MNGLLLRAAVVLGIGMGGVVDGFVLHHASQWQNRVMWLVTAAGIALLFRSGQQRAPFEAPVLGAGLAAGWGTFNFFEGLIDHQLLGLHHVRPGVEQFEWDLAFLGTGPILWALAILLLVRHYSGSVAAGVGPA